MPQTWRLTTIDGAPADHLLHLPRAYGPLTMDDPDVSEQEAGSIGVYLNTRWDAARQTLRSALRFPRLSVSLNVANTDVTLTVNTPIDPHVYVYRRGANKAALSAGACRVALHAETTWSVRRIEHLYPEGTCPHLGHPCGPCGTLP